MMIRMRQEDRCLGFHTFKGSVHQFKTILFRFIRLISYEAAFLSVFSDLKCSVFSNSSRHSIIKIVGLFYFFTFWKM